MPSIEPLAISCTSADCENDLHCFRSTKKIVANNQQGKCRYCGAELVDWNRVRTRSLTDADYTIDALQKELVRHHFWHRPIDEKARNHASRKGLEGLREAAEKRIRKYISPAYPSFDGRQTPWSGNVLYYAQHATAACCRKCVEEWHGIEVGRQLDESEILYLSRLMMLYVKQRLPQLE